MKPTLIACRLLKAFRQADCRPFSDQLRRLSSLRSGSLRSALLAALLLTSGHAAELHVAPNGNDANPGTAGKPLVSLQRARDVIREERAKLPPAAAAAQARIVLHAGTYRLTDTLALAPQDSNLIIEAAPGDRVVVSGGRVVTGWQTVKDGIVKADLSQLGLRDLKFREVYASGKRQHWARVPNFDPENPRRGGFLRNAGLVEPNTKTFFRYREGELDPAKWTEKEGVWVVFHDSLNYRPNWQPLRMKTLDPAARTFQVNTSDYVLSATSPYFICGLMSELDAPGEWCVDQQTKMLHFMPPGGKAENLEVTVPALDVLISLEGDAQSKAVVENVRLHGLAFAECRQEAVLMKGAVRCAVTACDIRNVGTGVFLGDDTHRCRIAGCDITQTLRDGVTVWGTTADHSRVTGHRIDNNYIWDFGWGDVHNRCGGVFMRRCSDVRVTHNHIHDGPRYAIGSDVGNDMEIAWNLCHHVNLTTSDTSIIEGGTAWDWNLPDDQERVVNRRHNWGNSIHHNLCYDSGGWSLHSTGRWSYPDYSWGIYLDLDNSGWHVHDNITYDTVLGGFMLNAGMENLVENNIFVGGRESQVRFNRWSGDLYIPVGHRCERNIIAYAGHSASLYLATGILPENCRYARNLIHTGAGTPRIEGIPLGEHTDSWSAWQALGQDAGSVLADPLFVDAAQHDYRLDPNSPAFKLGFHPIDLAHAGNYSSAERRTWPRPEEAVVRPPADYTEPRERRGQPALRDYEDYEPGEPERMAIVGPRTGTAFSGVTDAQAFSGKHSMQISKPAPGAGEKVSSPFITYPLTAATGPLKIAFALRFNPGASFLCETRNALQDYQTGPGVYVDDKGQLIAGGKPILKLPPETWIQFVAEGPLGKDAKGTYTLTVIIAGQKPQTFAGLPHSPKFQSLQFLVLMLPGTGSGTVWVDDLTIKAKP
ncbi:MAG: right-handed parallel beta-helix repeat-containing protein [Verrucomicrobia bacterium]|nr:right-handed parallel beta-helix repeat-containing protein [Verrucomicrobiota bacterium]